MCIWVDAIYKTMPCFLKSKDFEIHWYNDMVVLNSDCIISGNVKKSFCQAEGVLLYECPEK